MMDGQRLLTCERKICSGTKTQLPTPRTSPSSCPVRLEKETHGPWPVSLSIFPTTQPSQPGKHQSSLGQRQPSSQQPPRPRHPHLHEKCKDGAWAMAEMATWALPGTRVPSKTARAASTTPRTISTAATTATKKLRADVTAVIIRQLNGLRIWRNIESGKWYDAKDLHDVQPSACQFCKDPNHSATMCRRVAGSAPPVKPQPPCDF
mmetsp:Transcript_24447/g.42048  ORF Transcript_24447/g.42048 Transcript_24447/m.42048 type:complete len:206 (-) Transcript_24447:421-1038(-)